MYKKGVFSPILLMLYAVMSLGQLCRAMPAINVSVDRQQIAIGESIKYTVFIVRPKKVEIKDPVAIEGALGEFVIRDYSQTIKSDNADALELQYTLTAFKTGRQTIPEYVLEYRNAPDEQWQSLSARGIEITVRSVLGDGKDLALKPLKPKVVIWRDNIWWVIVLIVFIGAFWFLYKFWHNKKISRKEEVVVELAHIIAYRELEELQKSGFIDRGLMEEYYARLSVCLRKYLENRFLLRAPLMSTEEFLKAAKASPALNTAQRISLRDFLILCDLVKFARYGSSANEAQEAFLGAKNFIDQTKQEEVSKEKTEK